ncbi:saccharopine dehydrogenase C-terminal domain-containing protein [Acinetobacter baumannii]|nr:saccharopine dehydrogenase C-terminal domain-containing protein [Acinetobacter baumannii]
MTIGILGCGAMGRACAFAATRLFPQDTIHIIDSDSNRTANLKSWLSAVSAQSQTVAHVIDTTDNDSLSRVLGNCRIAIAALPWASTLPAVIAANTVGTTLVSLTRPDYSDIDTLQALNNRSLILLPCGLEPGLTEILARDLASRLDEVTEVSIRCGGIPIVPVPPLGYKLLFDDRLPVTMRPAYRIEGGKLIVGQHFDNLEELDIKGLGILEGHDDGMLPWLIEDEYLGNANLVTQKTLRWPGFAQAMTTLHRLGLLSDDPVNVGEIYSSPRQLIEELLRLRMSAAEKIEDLTILAISVSGYRKGKHVKLTANCMDYADVEKNLSSMARTTGFAAVSAAKMIDDGLITGSGWLMPHTTISGPLVPIFLDHLYSLGIEIILNY